MNKFNFNRFWNFGRWDLTVNRTFYRKSALFVIAIIFLPVLMKYTSVLWTRGVLMRQADPYDFTAMQDSLSGTVGWIGFVIPILMTLFMGYTFHNLLTRQGRINELTLPATNLERFVWHLSLMLVGGLLLIVLAVLFADLMHVVLGFCVAGQRHFNSLFLSVFKDSFEASGNVGGIDVSAGLPWLIGFFGGLFHLGVFVLGNAWKYRHNVIQTILFITAFSFSCVVLLGFSFTLMAGHMDFTEASFSFLEHVPEKLVFIGVLLVEMALCCLVYWLSYRLYCRAQVTTPRNP